MPTFGKVKYESVYPGIDLVYYGNQRQLEYDFIVAPQADPHVTKLRFTGVRKLRLDANGDLVLTTKAGQVRQQKPLVYQETNGVRQQIAGHYLLKGAEVSFALGAYDPSKPLVIDLGLSYSTFLGGPASEAAEAIAVDAAGNVYVTGWAEAGFPTTPAAFGSRLAMTTEAALTAPLPMALAGTTVRVRDSTGVERAALLFFVSPAQVNYLIPSGTASSAAQITVTSGDGTISTATAQIEAVAPGLFTANASGSGLAAAGALRVKGNGE